MRKISTMVFAVTSSSLGYWFCFLSGQIFSQLPVWLNNLLASCSFLLMMISGMYFMLKLAKPLLNDHLNATEH